MKTREQYLNGEISHNAYYLQFVNRIDFYTNQIGEDKILNSMDENLNDIPLQVWDSLLLERGVTNKLKEANEILTKSTKVCIAKASCIYFKKLNS